MPDHDLQVYCSRKGTDGCEWKGKLLNLAHHECSHQPVEPAHIMVRVNQMMHNMEDRHRRELEVVKISVRKAYRRELLMIVLVFLSLITAVGIPLLSQVMTTAHELTSMNSELTTAIKTTEKSLMTLKQEVDSKFAIVTKEADQSLMNLYIVAQVFYMAWNFVYKLEAQCLCVESYMHIHVQVTFRKKELVHSKLLVAVVIVL